MSDNWQEKETKLDWIPSVIEKLKVNKVYSDYLRGYEILKIFAFWNIAFTPMWNHVYEINHKLKNYTTYYENIYIIGEHSFSYLSS